MFDWFRKLFRRNQLSKAEEQDVAVSIREIDEGKSKRFTNADAMIADLKDDKPTLQKSASFPPVTLRHNQEATVNWEVNIDKDGCPSHPIIRNVRIRTIAEKNQERQQATMSHGLKSRNFKPRPAHERQTWDIRKKPTEED